MRVAAHPSAVSCHAAALAGVKGVSVNAFAPKPLPASLKRAEDQFLEWDYLSKG